MPYSILLVEDEGAASRYLRSIVELKCPDFRVVAVAEDGGAGLEAARLHRPDLVVTDIRMPGMDGLEFARRLKEEMPHTPAVIVSGYQEFEYARRALGTGVVEYLLKPVSARSLAEALESLRPRLETNAARKRRETLGSLLSGAVCAVADAADDAPKRARYWLALFREGGLPSRFRSETARDEEDGPGDEEVVSLRGRDARERFFLTPREKLDFDTFSGRVRGATGFASEAQGEKGRGYRTLVFAARDLEEEELAAGARELRRVLDHTIVLGESRLAFDTGAPPRARDWDPVLADRIEFCLANSRFDQVEAAVREAVAGWELERRPLIHAEAALRKLLIFMQRKALRDAGAAESELEYHLEAALAGAYDWPSLADVAWDLVRRAAGIDQETGGKVDAPAFFNSILRYVDEHYAEALSLGSVSETFRISQTYMSKLFRKHEDRSFNEYLTFRRIEAAKRLMTESPRMPLKDIAQCVGFQDPFYFSRVFKAVAGVPPSEYR